MLAIIYKSIASEGLSKDDILAMLTKAKRSNKKNKITGYLFYNKGQFIQLFEGEHKTTIELYTKIKSDSRHHHVQTLLERKTNHKTVEDWYMAFYDMTGELDEAGHRRLLLQTLDDTSPNQDILDFLKSEVFKMIRT